MSCIRGVMSGPLYLGGVTVNRWQNDALCFLYFVLKSFSVSPMYVSVVLLSLRVMVAW